MKGTVREHKEDGDFLWLTLEADPEIFKTSYINHFNRLLQRVIVPGFRRGHAPMDMVIHHMKMKGTFQQELNAVVSRVIEHTVNRMSEESGEWDEKIIGFPVENKISVFDLDKWLLTFESKFEKFPEVILSDYSKLETLIEYKDVDVDFLPLSEDKPAEKNDVVAVAMLGRDSNKKALNKYVYDLLEVDLDCTRLRKEIVDAILGSKAKDKQTITFKDGDEEISLELWIIDVRKKFPLDQALERTKSPDYDTADKLKEAIKQQRRINNLLARHQDVVKWAYSNDNQMEPFPTESVRREASKTYNNVINSGRKEPNFETLFFEHSKNLKVSLVLNAIAKKEKISIEDKDRAEFAKSIEECPWAYGNQKVEDIFNHPEEIVQQYILQYKVLNFLFDRWVFSS